MLIQNGAAALLILASAWGSSTAAQTSPPDLQGTWSGSGKQGAVFGQLGHQAANDEPVFADATRVWTLTIDTQEGRGLIGSWSSPAFSEPLVGVLRHDNESVLFADTDTVFIGTILSPTSMELCALEAGVSTVASCLILEKQ